MRALVVGSGVSGLMSAARLAAAGCQVTVFEQDDHIGGVTALAEKDGFRWEQGPLLLGDFLPGEKAAVALESLGIRLETIREERGIVMPDYEMWRPDEYEGPYWRRERLKSLFPAEAEGIDRYYRYYDDMLFLARAAETPRNLAERLRAALTYLRIKKYASLNARELMDRFFRDERIQGLFLGILADFCVAPSEFAGLGIPFVNVETAFDKRIPLSEGGRRVRGGFCYLRGSVYRLVEELARVIREKGGKIRTSSAVEKVLVEGGKVVGLRLANGEVEKADLVVGSGGAREFFLRLVGREYLTEDYARVVEGVKPMESVFMVHLGVDFDPLEYQRSALCYYYGTYDVESSIARLRRGEYHEGEDGFLVYVPSRANPELAPPGCHCVTIYTVAPDTLADGDWGSRKERYADKLVALAERRVPGLSAHTLTRLVKTPLDYRKMAHLDRSSFGGTVPDRKVRNPGHVTPVEGLYFVGAQSETQGGVSGCLSGADKAFSLIAERYGL